MDGNARETNQHGAQRLVRRRGSGYVAILGVSMIVTVIGLSALLAVRVDVRAAGLTEVTVQARFSAASLIEVALLRVIQDPGWRSTYSHNVWTAGEAIDEVNLSFKLVDELDGDLANDTTQLVRIYAKATVGDAVRTYSVLLEAEGADSGIVERRVAESHDDAEERSSDGRVYRLSSDLELIYDVADFNTDTVGIRFTNVTIAQGSTIQSAYLQFEVDETSSGAVSLQINGQDIDDASSFGSSTDFYDISSRSTTTASAAWSPLAWNSSGEAGINQRTPNISSIIQEIVDRPGWSSGNALVIIVTGTGTRWADAYDGDPTGAALLHVELGGSAGTVIPKSGTWRREVSP